MSLPRQIVVFLSLFVVATSVTGAGADPITVYSNFGPGMSYDAGPLAGWTINGFMSPAIGQQAVSQRFTAADDYVFRAAQLPIRLFSGPGSIDLYVQADEGGLPGGVLDVMHVRGLPIGATLVSADSTAHPLLTAGQLYWFSVVAGEPLVLAGWFWNNIGDVTDGANFASTQGGSAEGAWGLGSQNEPRSAFRIQAAPVPEPATLFLLGLGSGAVACRRVLHGQRH